MKLLAASLAILMGLFLVAVARAEVTAKPIDVWPSKAPGDSIKAPEEKWDKKKVTDVTHPTLEFFRPEQEKDTGVAVIVCPGGGYKNLMMDYEGEDVARWLNTIGVTGIVLKYRVPAPEGTPRWLPALQDAQRSISHVRATAKELGIDPNKIGILGFSAGGHLAAAASTNFDKRAYEAIDDIDKVSCRPDFAVVIYPGGIIENSKDASPAPAPGTLSAEIRVSKETPPAFIAMASNDPVNSENAVYYYLALKRNGVKADLHIYAIGGHGFGLRKSDRPCSTWPDRCAEWMHNTGILAPITAPLK